VHQETHRPDASAALSSPLTEPGDSESDVQGFKSWRSAYGTLIGIEKIHMLRKGQAGLMTPRQEVEFIHRVMGVA
jgi:hypothetical protein